MKATQTLLTSLVVCLMLLLVQAAKPTAAQFEEDPLKILSASLYMPEINDIVLRLGKEQH